MNRDRVIGTPNNNVLDPLSARALHVVARPYAHQHALKIGTGLNKNGVLSRGCTPPASTRRSYREGSGKLEAKLSSRMMSNGISPAAAAQAAQRAQATQQQQPESHRELRQKLRPVFNRFDEDGSGSVSTAEMGKMLKQIGEPHCRL